MQELNFEQVESVSGGIITAAIGAVAGGLIGAANAALSGGNILAGAATGLASGLMIGSGAALAAGTLRVGASTYQSVVGGTTLMGVGTAVGVASAAS